jgi:transposase
MKRLILENSDSIVNKIRCYLDNNSEAQFIHRLHVLMRLGCSKNESCDSLGALFGNSPRSVSNWIKKVNRTGDIESLRNKPLPGRPARLTKSQKVEIKAVLQKMPEKCGQQGRKWNGMNLSSYISGQYGVVLKERSCQRLLRELNRS